MAITLKIRTPKNIPWTLLVFAVTLIGIGAFGWQLWVHGLDRPISDASIRSQQLRLSTADLQRLQDQLTAYHKAPAPSEAVKGDPLTPTKSSTGTNP
jgi:hypothetical protein